MGECGFGGGWVGGVKGFFYGISLDCCSGREGECLV